MALEFVQIAGEMTFVPKERPELGEMAGDVVQVTGADLFRIRNTAGVMYYFRLDRVQTLQPWQLQTRQQRQLWEQGKSNLSQLILSNQVRIDVTATNQNLGGLGIVYRGVTNVNIIPFPLPAQCHGSKAPSHRFLNRRRDDVAVLGPAPIVIFYVLQTEQIFQYKPGMAGPFADAAIGNGLFVCIDALLFEID